MILLWVKSSAPEELFPPRSSDTVRWTILCRDGGNVGFFDSLSNGFKRLSNPLSETELKEILDGRSSSELAGYYFGQIYPPRLRDWTTGLLAVFTDGSGRVFWETSPYPGRTDRNFIREESWNSGGPTNRANDSTPLLIGPNGYPFEKAQNRYLPRKLTSQSPGEMILVFENMSNDYDSDGSSSWVSGASHSQGTVFMGLVHGRGASLLRQRCEGRQGW